MTQIDVEAAVDRHFARVYRAALMLTGNPWDADDLAQETFLVLARNGNRFEGRSSEYTWLYGILLNLERRLRRQHGVRRRRLESLRKIRDTEQANAAAESPVEVAEWRESLWAQVALLPEVQRQTLVLRFSEGLRYHEIAEILECPLGTVKSRIFHGLAAMRRLLKTTDESIQLMPDVRIEDLNHAI